MKAILIDSNNETITLVDIDDKNKLSGYYKHLECRSIQVAHYVTETDCIYCDEDGLVKMNPNSKFFGAEGAHQPFFIGKGLVVGTNPSNGESITPKIKVEDVMKKIKFYTLPEVRMM